MFPLPIIQLQKFFNWCHTCSNHFSHLIRKPDSLKPLLSKPSFATCTTSSVTCLSHLIWVMGFSVLQIYFKKSQCRPFLMVSHKQSYLSCLLPFLSIFQRNFSKEPVICIETHNLITQALSKKFKP